MLTLKLLPHLRPPPLTLIPCYNLIEPSRPSSSVITSLFIAVFLTSICFSSIISLANAKNISTSSAPSHVKTKSCSLATDCKDPYSHKECVNGKCQCKPFFDYIPEDDSCAKTYGATCTVFEASDKELCNVNKFLACDETGTCSCHREGNSLLIYDPYLDTCAAPPGHHCEFEGWGNVKKECVQNAKCVHDLNRTVDSNFFGICECSQNFVPKGEKCVPKLGSPCELNGDCDQDEMRCLNGKCVCEEDRVYFENGYACKVKVGETCEVAQRDCADYAECRGTRNEMSHWEWQCLCQLGYHEAAENGTCVKDSHETCRDPKIYDEKRGRCSLTVGRSCEPSDVNLCVIHAFCGTGNKCQCFAGYEMTFNATCDKTLNKIDKITTAEPEKNPVERSTAAPIPVEASVANERRSNGALGRSLLLFNGVSLFRQIFITTTVMVLIV